MAIENFEKLLEHKSQTRFMTVYYWYMMLEVISSSVKLINSLDFDCSSVELSMKQDNSIPDHLRLKFISHMFASIFGHVSEDQ